MAGRRAGEEGPVVRDVIEAIDWRLARWQGRTTLTADEARDALLDVRLVATRETAR